MSARRAVGLAVSIAALVAGMLTVAASPAAAAVYSRTGTCTSPSDPRNSMQASFEFESSGSSVRLRRVSILLYRDNALTDWGTSASVADRTSSINYWSFSHNPPSAEVYLVPSLWTAPTFRNGRVSVNGCTIIRYA